MEKYEMFGQAYRAWSKMECNKVRGNKRLKVEPTDHQPHVWESEFTLYGPYFCEGLNPVPPYKPKHAKETA
jgi:hypothetical protein